jgi:hypothetical protein
MERPWIGLGVLVGVGPGSAGDLRRWAMAILELQGRRFGWLELMDSVRELVEEFPIPLPVG